MDEKTGALGLKKGYVTDPQEDGFTQQSLMRKHLTWLSNEWGQYPTCFSTHKLVNPSLMPQFHNSLKPGISQGSCQEKGCFPVPSVGFLPNAISFLKHKCCAMNWSGAPGRFKTRCLYELVLTLSLLWTALVQRFMPAQAKGDCGGRKSAGGQWDCFISGSADLCSLKASVKLWPEGGTSYLCPSAVQRQWCTDRPVHLPRPDPGLFMQRGIKSLSEKDLWTRSLQALLLPQNY